MDMSPVYFLILDIGKKNLHRFMIICKIWKPNNLYKSYASYIKITNWQL